MVNRSMLAWHEPVQDLRLDLYPTPLPRKKTTTKNSKRDIHIEGGREKRGKEIEISILSKKKIIVQSTILPRTEKERQTLFHSIFELFTRLNFGRSGEHRNER